MRRLACLVAAGMLSLSASGMRAETMAYGEAYDTLYQFGCNDLPFGGVGASGMGHYHGRDGFLTFSKAMPIL